MLELAQHFQLALRVAFVACGLVFIVGAIALRRWSWFAAHLALCALAALSVDHIGDSNDADPWRVGITMVILVVRALAHYELCRDALSPVAGWLWIMLVTGFLGAITAGLTAFVSDDYNSAWWLGALAIEVQLGVMALLTLIAMWDRPVKGIYRLFGGTWVAFLVSYLGNAVPVEGETSAWYLSTVGYSGLKAACLIIWTWIAVGGLWGGPRPSGKVTASSGKARAPLLLLLSEPARSRSRPETQTGFVS